MSRPSSVPALRAAFIAACVASLILPSMNGAVAQAPARRLAFRIPSGAFIPTGTQRGVLKNAHVTAAQLSWLVRPSLAITGTFAWARSRDVATDGAPKLDVFTSDVGIETRTAEWCSGCGIAVSGFAGLGAGVRSYNYRNLDVDATNNLAGYAAAGGELGMGRMALRLEVRDYATGFRPLVGAGRSDARNDVVVMAAARFNRRKRS